MLALPVLAQPSRATLVRLLGDIPKAPPLKVDTLEKRAMPGGMRYHLKWLLEPADAQYHTPPDYGYAYLFVPQETRSRKLPAVVAIHQDGPRDFMGYREVALEVGDADQHYGLELFRRGYVVICPDRHLHGPRRRIPQQDTAGEFAAQAERAANHWSAQLLMQGRTYSGKEAYELMRATDVLCRTPGVDTSRIGAVGHSAGGYALGYFMFLDRRIKAGVSSCGVFEINAFYDERAPRKNGIVPVLPGAAKAGTATADYIGHLAPRPFLMTRGMHEWGKGDSAEVRSSAYHVNATRNLEDRARRLYATRKAADRLKTLYFDENEGQHSFPPGVKAQAYAWLDAQLKR